MVSGQVVMFQGSPYSPPLFLNHFEITNHSSLSSQIVCPTPPHFIDDDAMWNDGVVHLSHRSAPPSPHPLSCNSKCRPWMSVQCQHLVSLTICHPTSMQICGKNKHKHNMSMPRCMASTSMAPPISPHSNCNHRPQTFIGHLPSLWISHISPHTLLPSVLCTQAELSHLHVDYIINASRHPHLKNICYIYHTWFPFVKHCVNKKCNEYSK
jgi:hypothetical protein